MLLKKALLLPFLASVSLLTLSSYAHANDPNGDSSVITDLQKLGKGKPVFLQRILDEGDKLYYIGSFRNYRSYVAESKTGKFLIVNILADEPDSDTAVLGELVTGDGVCVTCDQLHKFNDRTVAKTRGTMSENSTTTDPDVKIKEAPKIAVSAGLNKPVSSSLMPGPLSLSDIRKEQRDDDGGSSSFLARSKWSDFSLAADKSAYFDVGSEKAPLLYMLADPHCPYCHHFWTRLKPLVESNKLRVRIILASILPGSGPDTHNLLGNPNIGEAWLRGEGSIEGYPITPTAVPGSQAYQDADKAFQYNGQFASKYLPIEAPAGSEGGGTPLFAYQGKDGRFYAAEGPNDLDGFLRQLIGQ